MKRFHSWLSFLGRLFAANPYAISDGVRTPDGNGTVIAIDRDAVKVFINTRRERWYTVRQVEFVTYRRAA